VLGVRAGWQFCTACEQLAGKERKQGAQPKRRFHGRIPLGVAGTSLHPERKAGETSFVRETKTSI
jgi:hypothetical protein